MQRKAKRKTTRKKKVARKIKKHATKAKMKYAQVETATFPVAKLDEADYNPRTVTAATIRALGVSLDKFGLIALPVVNAQNKKKPCLIAGHKRLRILKERGVTEVTCVVVRFDEDKEKAANLALNDESIQGEFLPEATLHVLERVKQLCAKDDSRIRDLRMSSLEQEMRRARATILDSTKKTRETRKTGRRPAKAGTGEQTKRDVDADANTLPVMAKTEAASALGVIYQLGSHLLFCGKIKKVGDLNYFGTEQARCAFFSCHSNMKLTANYLDLHLKHIIENTSGGIYVATTLLNLAVVQDRFTKLGGHWSTTLLWYEQSEREFEGFEDVVRPVVYGWRKESSRIFNGAKAKGNVFNIEKQFKHMPVTIPERAIVNSSDEGDFVLGLGKDRGTSLIACERTGRAWIGYVDTTRDADRIRKRWANFVHGANADWQTLTPTK